MQVVSDNGIKMRILEACHDDDVILVVIRLLLKCLHDITGRQSVLMWPTGYVIAAIYYK